MRCSKLVFLFLPSTLARNNIGSFRYSGSCHPGVSDLFPHPAFRMLKQHLFSCCNSFLTLVAFTCYISNPFAVEPGRMDFIIVTGIGFGVGCLILGALNQFLLYIFSSFAMSNFSCAKTSNVILYPNITFNEIED